MAARARASAPGLAGRQLRCRAGRIPLWLALGLGLAAAGLAARGLGRSALARGFTDIDTRRVSLEAGRPVPAGWSEWLAARVAALDPVSTLDADGVAALTAEIARAPFVRAVRDARVVWPDGLELEIELRRPAACLRAPEGFRCVDPEGVVLPGVWTTPPETDWGVLSVIGPLDGALDDLRPGDRLVEERHHDALSVALSMRAHLDRDELRFLGPVVIDAERADRAGVEESGTRLSLEDRRLVLFGRAPRAGMPGELPPARKWQHLRRALRWLREGRDWDLLDVRWDRGRIRPRGDSS